MPETHGSPLARVLEFQRRTVELVAEEVRPIEEGWVVRTPSLPEVWFLNRVHVRAPIPYEHALALCRRHRHGARYDQIYFEDEAAGEVLAPRFRADGWEVDVEVSSVLGARPDREVDAANVIEPSQDEALALMKRWIAEDETLHLTQDGVRQLLESNRRTWRVRNARRLGVRGPAGELVGVTLVYSDGSVAQVENVYVVPEARGRAYARAMVSQAAALARRHGHQLTFIVADDNDWPKHLYAKLGFVPVGRTWMFHRELA